MTHSSDILSEQLSAFMDGELPEADAKFLRSRLAHDQGLRDEWQRMHVASTCLRGQPWRLMSSQVAIAVAAEILAPSTRPAPARRPVLGWAMAASVAVLGLMLVPRLMQAPQPLATVQPSEPARIAASPASADLVASQSGATTVAALPSVAPATAPELVAIGKPAARRSSPLPLNVQSPTDFPLVDTGDRRHWPRSELLTGTDEPALEAYLVRHNQMLANDGLSGFVPYVDVVASEQPAVASGDEAGASQP